MTVIKSKTRKGYGTVTLEHVTIKTTSGTTHTGYLVLRNGVNVGAMRSNKADAMKFWKRECVRVFGGAP